MWVSILRNEKASVTQHKYKLHITHCKVAKKKQSLSSRATWALPECSIRALTVTPRLRNTSSFGPVSAPKTAFHWYKWEFQKIGKKIAFYGTIGRKKVSRSHRLWRCILWALLTNVLKERSGKCRTAGKSSIFLHFVRFAHERIKGTVRKMQNCWKIKYFLAFCEICSRTY